MTIRYITGDVTRPQAPPPLLVVHICNDKGLWGAGVSGAIGKRWPVAERAYRDWSKRNSSDAPSHVFPAFKLGQIKIVPDDSDTTVGIVNLIGQHGVRSHMNPWPVRYEAIREALGLVFEEIMRFPGSHFGATVHMPRIGCGLAGGTWGKVEPIIKSELADKGVEVYVYDL